MEVNDMSPIEITIAIKAVEAAPALAIVWRNPNQVSAHRRRHNFKQAVCTMQEFVEDGRLGYWTTIGDLEVLAGGRAA
jgi:hypothetical protein